MKVRVCWFVNPPPAVFPCCRFGVKQREKLAKTVSAPPHTLLMTATPIPRTLALVQFGGLSLSTISSMPPGRSRVATKVVTDAEDAREEVREHRWLQICVRAQHAVLQCVWMDLVWVWVCPAHRQCCVCGGGEDGCRAA